MTATKLNTLYNLHRRRRGLKSAFNRILRSCGVNILGVELKHRTQDRWLVILADASETGRFRCQYFDRHGLWSHSTQDTAHEVLRGAIDEGFQVIDAGALDRLGQTDEWRRGMEALFRIMTENQRTVSRGKEAVPC